MAPARRGRGQGRRVGRGRGGTSRSVLNRSSKSTESAVEKMDMDSFNMATCDVKTLFLSADAQFEIHLKAQEQNKYRYCAAMIALERNGVELLQTAKVRALASSWARCDQELSKILLANENQFGVVEVLKALNTLDSGRRMRVEEKQMAKLKQAAKTAGTKGKSRIGRKLVTIKKNIHNFNALKPTKGTVSGALARKIKRWTRNLPKEKLEFYALHLPTETWTQLADMCHLHPEKDFPSLPWFLRYCFDKQKAPEGTLVHQCVNLNQDNVNEHVMGVDVPYTHIKQYAGRLSEDAKKRIAQYTPDVDTLLWEYEDLKCNGVDEVISQRLNNGESVKLPFGKLMERLLMLRKLRHQGTKGQNQEIAPFYPKLLPYAEEMLGSMRAPIESPVVVIGDASASMTVAIETSTIIASFLRALTSAQLVFFSRDVILPPFIPQTMEEVLELAMVVKTVGCTCHASGLWPFYEKKEVVKTFIVTTDEEENTDLVKNGKHYRFQNLFEKYHKEVYPARLVFVSFLSHQHAKGQMVESLKAAGYDVMQFKLDHNRPDLTKLNNLVGQLSMESKDFESQVNELEQQLRSEGLQKGFDNLIIADSDFVIVD